MYVSQCIISWIAMMLQSVNLANLAVFFIKFNKENLANGTTIAHISVLALALFFQAIVLGCQIKITMFANTSKPRKSTADQYMAQVAKRQAAEKKGKPGMVQRVKNTWYRHLGERGPFKYPSWFLASLLTSVVLLAFSTTKAVDMVDHMGWCVGDIKGCMQFMYNERFEGTDVDAAKDMVTSFDEILLELNLNQTQLVVDAMKTMKVDADKVKRMTDKLKRAHVAVEATLDLIETFVKNLRIARFVGIAVGCLVSAFTIAMNAGKCRAPARSAYLCGWLSKSGRARFFEQCKRTNLPMTTACVLPHLRTMHRAIFWLASLHVPGYSCL